MSQTIIIQADYLLPSVFHQNMGLSCLSWKSGNCFGNCNILVSSHHIILQVLFIVSHNKVAQCVRGWSLSLITCPDDLCWTPGTLVVGGKN